MQALKTHIHNTNAPSTRILLYKQIDWINITTLIQQSQPHWRFWLDWFCCVSVVPKNRTRAPTLCDTNQNMRARCAVAFVGLSRSAKSTCFRGMFFRGIFHKIAYVFVDWTIAINRVCMLVWTELNMTLIHCSCCQTGNICVRVFLADAHSSTTTKRPKPSSSTLLDSLQQNCLREFAFRASEMSGQKKFTLALSHQRHPPKKKIGTQERRIDIVQTARTNWINAICT